MLDPLLQNEENGSNKVKQIDGKMFAIPAWLDMIESVLRNIAVTLIAASIV